MAHAPPLWLMVHLLGLISRRKFLFHCPKHCNSLHFGRVLLILVSHVVKLWFILPVKGQRNRSLSGFSSSTNFATSRQTKKTTKKTTKLKCCQNAPVLRLNHLQSIQFFNKGHVKFMSTMTLFNLQQETLWFLPHTN